MPAAAVPQPAALLRDFANTLDVEDGTDSLSTPAELTRWLRDHDLLDASTAAGDDDLALARRLRDLLRAAFRANHGDAAVSEDSAAATAEVTSRLPLAVRLLGERPTFVPVEPGVRGGLARLLAAAADCGAEGSWSRLKICVADDCAWAFYDASKNRSKTWCSMQACGNRAKTRSYRTRRTAAS